MSLYHLSNAEKKQLQLGLDHSFTDHKKHIKNLSAALEAVAQRTADGVDHTQLEEFHNFWGKYTDKFTTNVLKTKDITYYNLKDITNNKIFVVLKGDKDSSIAIMDKSDYVSKFHRLIEKGIDNSVYAPTNNTTLEDLKFLHNFLYRDFQNHNTIKNAPLSYQPTRLYRAAAIHEFEHPRDTTKENQFPTDHISSCTYTYNTAQVILNYFKYLCKN